MLFQPQKPWLRNKLWPATLQPVLFLSPYGPFYSDLGTTQVTTNGSLVRRWCDVSGNGRHADSPSDAVRPTLGISGSKTWMTFNKATPTYMDSTVPAGSLTNNFFLVLACRPTSVGGDNQMPLCFGENTNGKRRNLWINSDSKLSFNGQFADVIGSTTAVNNTDYRWTVGVTGTSLTIRVNNVSAGTGTPSLITTTGAVSRIGANIVAGEGYSGRVYAALGFERELNIIERDLLDKYLISIMP